MTASELYVTRVVRIAELVRRRGFVPAETRPIAVALLSQCADDQHQAATLANILPINCLRAIGNLQREIEKSIQSAFERKES